jgi:predicted DNA-binding mobile mystery protein A
MQFIYIFFIFKCILCTEPNAMNPDFKNLRLRQLERNLRPFLPAREVPRPQKGWIRAIREATGMTLLELATRMKRSLSLAAQFEKSEAEYRITLGSLRQAADALGCDLVYALVPKQGTVQDLAKSRAIQEATADVLAVEHTMALEDQAVGGVKEKIQEEANRLLKQK